MGDVYNTGRFDLSRENVLLRGGQCVRLVAFMAVSVVIVIVAQTAVAWATAPGVRDWVACDATSPISDELRGALAADLAPYGCTTRRVTRSMPCLCCVGAHCWRGATIVKNATAMATMWDRVADGRLLQRRLPSYAVVLYEASGSSETYVRQEIGETVGDLFRVLEYLHNLTPDGTEVPDADL